MAEVTMSDVATMPTPDVSIDGATTGIPFILASQRQATKPEVINDTIIIVSEGKKKRKRAAAAKKVDVDGEKSTANLRRRR